MDKSKIHYIEIIKENDPNYFNEYLQPYLLGKKSLVILFFMLFVFFSAIDSLILNSISFGIIAGIVTAPFIFLLIYTSVRSILARNIDAYLIQKNIVKDPTPSMLIHYNMFQRDYRKRLLIDKRKYP